MPSSLRKRTLGMAPVELWRRFSPQNAVFGLPRSSDLDAAGVVIVNRDGFDPRPVLTQLLTALVSP
jgi:hypothetical protein